MKNTKSIQASETDPHSFTTYAKETINDYLQRDQFGKQLLKYQIKQEIQNYQDLLQIFYKIDKRY
jgi:hypothetical protein